MATGTTLNYSLPYPKSTDPVNVASDIQDLATSLDTDLPEIIQDLSSSMITGGTNYGISTSYNDTTGILSIGVIDDGHSHIAGNIDDLQASLDLKSNIDSPVFTGNPTAPTPSLGDNDSSLATTSFVTSAIDAIESSAVYYQDDAPLSPEVGSVWVDSDEVFSSFSSNDFILKSGGVFTGNIEGTTANFTGNLDGTTANLAGYITVGSTTQSTTTGVNVIVGNASHIGVVVKSQVSQTANIQEWQSGSGLVLSSVSSLGKFVGVGAVSYQSSEPPSPSAGIFWVDSDVNTASIYNGLGWIPLQYSSLNIPITQSDNLTKILSLSDNYTMIRISHPNNNSVLIPFEGSQNFPIGSQILIVQEGSGQVTIEGDAQFPSGVSVTVNGTPGLKLRTQWSSATLIKTGADRWLLVGDLTA